MERGDIRGYIQDHTPTDPLPALEFSDQVESELSDAQKLEFYRVCGYGTMDFTALACRREFSQNTLLIGRNGEIISGIFMASSPIDTAFIDTVDDMFEFFSIDVATDTQFNVRATSLGFNDNEKYFFATPEAVQQVEEILTHTKRPQLQIGASATDLFIGGINNGVQIPRAIFHGIVKKYSQENKILKNKQSLIALRNSYPLMVKLALINMHNLPLIGSKLIQTSSEDGYDYVDPEKVHIMKNGGIDTLETAEELTRKFGKSCQEKPVICPAFIPTRVLLGTHFDDYKEYYPYANAATQLIETLCLYLTNLIKKEEEKQ